VPLVALPPGRILRASHQDRSVLSAKPSGPPYSSGAPETGMLTVRTGHRPVFRVFRGHHTNSFPLPGGRPCGGGEGNSGDTILIHDRKPPALLVSTH